MTTPDFLPTVGLVGEAHWIIAPEHLADTLGNDGVKVLATPMLLDLMELAAHNALVNTLPEGWITLGIHANFRHLKMTPPGYLLRARAVVTAVDRQKVHFNIEVHDDIDLVGEGTHERFCMPRQDFLRIVEKKRRAIQERQ